MFFRPTRVAALITLIAVVAGLGLAVSIARATSSDTPAPSSVDQVVVDPNAIERSIPPTFFGINYTAFWDQNQGSRASATALRQTAIHSLRFPGGVPGDWYDWQDPYYKGRTSTSPMKLWQYGRSFGASRALFQTNYQGNLPNPPGKSYAVNSPQNAAAWVAYNRRAGIQADMEVGNEEDMNSMHTKDDPGFESYITAFNAQARAMHRANPRVRVLGPAGTNEYFWWHFDGLGEFLQGAGNRTGSGQADGISLHYYVGTDWTDAEGVAQHWMSPNGPWAAIQQMIRAHDTRKLPVYITEWNLGNSDSNNHNAFTPTLGHALAVTDMIGAFAASGVTQEDYFDLHGAQNWGLLYGPGENRPVDSPSPTYYAMALWRHMGNRLVSTRQSDDAASVMSTYATTRRDGSVQVLAINKLMTPRTVQVALQGATPRGHRLHVYSLRGVSGSVDDLDAFYDGKKMPSPQRRLPGPQLAGTIHGNVASYRVPANSAVILDLDSTTRAPTLRWPTPKRTPPPPAPTISASGQVAQATLKAGESQTLTATVRSTADVGTALVDFEVYDSMNRKVFQDAPSIDLRASKPVTLTRTFTPSSSAYGGQYHFKLGVFGRSWSPLYAWNDEAGGFTVAGNSPPTVNALGQAEPAHLQPGAPVALTATVSASGNNLTDALVDFEIYNAAGAKVWQSAHTGIDLSPGADARLVDRWTIPSGQAGGTYTFKIGVFGSQWAPLYTWNDQAATFTIGG